MKRIIVLFLFSTFTTLANAQNIQKNILHLDPEMTGNEYRALFDKLEKRHTLKQDTKDVDPLEIILEYGKRNLDWIEAINKNRDDEHKLKLTTPELTRAYPIETPCIFSPSIIENDLETLKKQMPIEMANVIFGTSPISDFNPIDDQIFLDNARLMNRIYETACRWLLQKPFLKEYTENAKKDIRGYYFLNKEKELENKFNDWPNLNEETQKKYSDWLIGECNNSSESIENCQAGLEEAIKANKVFEYHTKYVKKAEEVYNAYFELQNPRPEVIWNYKSPDEMDFPFTQPDRKDVEDWFKTNIEDEFHFDSWALKINFKNEDHLAKIVFKSGVTPTANDLGGDTITMDSNYSLNEYSVTWIIRHEFGHILGLPDCYVEFYDKKNGIMVNYQIDITNLMCSRRGHLQKQHYEQLKKYYYKENA